MPIIEDLEQQSADWLKMRVGMVTGSRVAEVMSFLTRESKNGKKGDETGDRKKYRYEIVIECLTGLSAETPLTKAMEWGILTEPLAREVYEMETGLETRPIGFAIHDAISRFGASPDALVGPDGLLEIKCPTTMVHLQYVEAGVVPDEYKPQLLAEMACTGRKWVDFVSFDPRLPKRLRLFVRRFHWDDKAIGEMERAVEQFLVEVDRMLLRLQDGGDLTAILTASLPNQDSQRSLSVNP